MAKKIRSNKKLVFSKRDVNKFLVDNRLVNNDNIESSNYNDLQVTVKSRIEKHLNEKHKYSSYNR